ncbi:NADPH-dependent FMN reductase [Halomicroarcula sp. GCM10025324]|uniref:NADPH-dependent FMN reductase n=1 Tax=Haloarcula TaxID=2237 RepID=UPI0023E7ED20|nr:NADPH-dependent FMN reductase [Halomicroarcula sp. ZS-22-S1]
MTEPPTVVGLSGSLRDDSGTRIAVDRALAAADEAGATTEHIDLREWDLPLYDADANEAGDGPALATRIREADAAVVGTPMYHGTVASPLKTALDYCSIDDVEGTAVGLVAVAGGGFPTPALEHLRASLLALKARPLPTQVAIPDSWKQFEDGQVVDDDVADRLAMLGEAVTAEISGEAGRRVAETVTPADD